MTTVNGGKERIDEELIKFIKAILLSWFKVSGAGRKNKRWVNNEKKCLRRHGCTQ